MPNLEVGNSIQHLLPGLKQIYPKVLQLFLVCVDMLTLSHLYHPGQFIPEHHTLPGHKSHLMAPDHLGGIDFDLQLLWSAQTFDSPYQLWRATSSYSR